MKTLAFKAIPNSRDIVLKVATTQRSTILTLDVWDQVSNKNIRRTGYSLELLDGKPLEQLEKVFTDCVHPQQYIPSLFTKENRNMILEAGLHISERILPYSYYTHLGDTSVPQHCKYTAPTGKLNICFFLLLLMLYLLLLDSGAHHNAREIGWSSEAVFGLGSKNS